MRSEKQETKKDILGVIMCEERRDYVEIVRELGCREGQCVGEEEESCGFKLTLTFQCVSQRRSKKKD